mgnify:CR=1 FL=1
MKKTSEQLTENIEEQIQFLQTSVNQFDSGMEAESKRMAVAARVLLYDSSHSMSIIKQLGIRDVMLFISSTYQYMPVNMVPYLGLIGIASSDGKGKYTPFCKMQDPHEFEKWHKLDDWWNELVIDDKSYKFTRKDIVKLLANTDGGAHVDPTSIDEYDNLIYDNSLGWCYSNADGVCALDNNAAYVTMRQIAHEIIRSFTLYKHILSSTKEEVGCGVAVYLPKKILRRNSNKIEEAVYFVPERLKDDPIASKLLFPASTVKTEDRKVYIESIVLSDQKSCKRICII